MNEIQDLKNIVLALDAKINNLLLIIQGFHKSNENVNEVLNLIHNLGFERSKQNNVLFENIYPDLIRRINKLENFQSEEVRILSLPVQSLNFKHKRTLRCMVEKGIKDVASILKHSEYEFLSTPNFGKKSLMDLKETLSRHNLKLKSHGETRLLK